jgi:hypothetical protein
MRRHGSRRLSGTLIVVLCVLAVSALGAGMGKSELPATENPKDHIGYRATVPIPAIPAAPPALKSGDGPTLTPAVLNVTLQPGESIEESKLLHLPESPAPQRADVLWCFDLTGSMGGEVDTVKTNSLNIMNGIRSLIPDSRFGVVSHMDYTASYDYCGYSSLYGSAPDGDYPYRLDQPLTSDLAAVQTAISGLVLGWGVDNPEDYGRVLWETYNDPNIVWRSGAAKFVVQWGDDRPHDCDLESCLANPGVTTGIDPGRDGIAGTPDDLPIMDVLNGMASQNICLIPMFSGGYFYGMDLWNCFAGVTGCSAFEINADGTIPGGVDIVDYIVSAIGQQFTHINHMTLQVCTPGFESWLVGVTPAAYVDIDLDVPQDLPFTITIQVPPDTDPGVYCFQVCAIGDGAVYATQDVCVTVESGDCIHLDIGEVWGNPGDDIWVPVYIQDVTGWGIVGAEGQICWCDVPSGLLQFIGCEGGPMAQAAGWEGFCNECSPNCVSIAGAGASPLEGEGVFFWLIFHISANAKPCMCCDLTFEYMNLYDPERTLRVCLDDGWVCINKCEVEGTVNYWKCCQDECGEWYLNHPLAGVNVALMNCYGPVESDLTDGDGYYRFECLDPIVVGCPYCVSVDYCNPLDECITAYDASLILQYLVCLDPLDDCPFTVSGGMIYPQRVAADANCSNQITAYDASLVLQYVVGLIDLFPCYDPWHFYALDGPCAFTCPGTVDFIGVRVGEVSGCPTCPLLGPTVLASSEAAVVKLGRASHVGETVEVPVVVRGASGIQSVEFDLSYNVRDFRVASVEPAGLASSFMTFWNASDGNLSVAMAGMTPFSGRGQIAVVRFEKLHEPIPALGGRIALKRVLFNEGTPEAVIEGGAGEIADRFALGPVTPNPFVGGTEIVFSIPASSRVTVGVYDVSGRLVSTLVDDMMPAGRQSVSWDGKDAAGRSVARGVYFCRMEAGTFMATEKLVLLK